ncbi:hypothetical protein SCUP515_02611 [Seiridium cupressi]
MSGVDLCTTRRFGIGIVEMERWLRGGLITQLAGEWFVDSPEFYIDGEVVENSSSGSPFPGSQSLVDTGTAYIQTPDYQTALDIYAAISPEIAQIDKAGAWGAPCATMERLQPELTFTLGTGSPALNLTVPKDSVNLGEYPSQPGICQGVILNPVQPVTEVATLWVLGSPLLKAYYTVWDGGDMQLGIADLTTQESDATPTESPKATATPSSGNRLLSKGVYAACLLAILTLL